MRTVRATPDASILIESMRDIGYSLETALADVVDNSITAGATTIHLLAGAFDSVFKIGILDDGTGMSEEELLVAMKPGSRSPLEERHTKDLGRFGLGLKTASFSQCRRFSVVTRKDGGTSAAAWDLDRVAVDNDWIVELPEVFDRIQWSEQLGRTGTLVVWEKLDRLVERNDSDSASARFSRRLDEASRHLEMVFHRFLAGEPGLRKVGIVLNGRPLEPFDPFHSMHPATIKEPAQPEIVHVDGHQVAIQTFTLPHHKKVSASDWEKYAGSAGYLKNQGFYIYREKRLIIHGTWFGLAKQTELTKLTRVRIDIPNGLDAEWKIDVKKASAQPPPIVRERLRRIIETIGATSKRVYTSRGRRLTTDNQLPVWIRVQDKNDIIYRVNPNHPVFEELRLRLPQNASEDFLKVLELVGSTLPVDALFTDLNGEPEHVRGNDTSDEVLWSAIRSTVHRLNGIGVDLEEAAEMMRTAEPFRSKWQKTQEYLDRLASEEYLHV